MVFGTTNVSKVWDQTTLRVLPDSTVFTFVRDPMATVVSAYLEIRDRTPLNISAARFGARRCTDVADADVQFRRFLSAIAAGSGRYGAEFFHAFPQVLKINHVRHNEDRPRRFDAIGRLESFSDGLAILRTRGLGLPLGNCS